MSDLALIKQDGKRLDGRIPDELRDIKIESGIVEKANGSAYIEWGENKVIASVFLRNVPSSRRGVEDISGILNCRYNMSPFSVDYRKRPGFDRRSTEISMKMTEALQNVVLLEEIPRTIVDVYVEIMEAAGGTRCASITAASVALADAELPMKDLLPSCAVGKVEDVLVLDLLKEEDNFGDGDIPMAWVPGTKEFVLLQMDGVLNKEELKTNMELGIKGCQEIHKLQLDALNGRFKPGDSRDHRVINSQANFFMKEISQLREKLENGQRMDNRDHLKRREVEVETRIIGTADGSARVRMGNTEVIAGVKFELGTPYPDHPDEGTLSTHLDLSPISLYNFGQSNTRPRETELARVIDRGIRQSECIDLKAMCITPGEEVITTYIDLLVVNYDGNIYDAGNLASLAALSQSSVPFSKFDKGDDRLMEISHLPISSTFVKIDGKILLDPTYLEEMASEAMLTITTDENSNIRAMQKGVWGGFTSDEIMNCLDTALESDDLRTGYFS
jgi:exosome complex component RRP41